MTERTSHPQPQQDYIPGLGKHVLQPLYDLVHHAAGLRRIHSEMISLAELGDGHRVLDVGCGTGQLLRSIGRRHAGVDLVGLDPDPQALARAERKTRRAGLTARLDNGFAQDLPYPDDAFDRVFSSLMLHHLDSAAKDALLAEVRRVLRPDGLLILADAKLDEHGHDWGHGHRGMRGRMRDNIGDAVPRRITAAGFTLASTRTMRLRIGGAVGIELAHREREPIDEFRS